MLELDNLNSSVVKLNMNDLMNHQHHHHIVKPLKVKKPPPQFPIQFVPQCRSDIFYRGSLLKAGFLLSRGQSASCPDIYVHSPRKRKGLRKYVHDHCNHFNVRLSVQG